MNSYEINASTLCIIPIGKDKSCVYELESNFVVNMSCLKIIERSCLFFGSTYEGRRNASSKIINSLYKVPIIIEESCNMIFFPTISPLSNDCIWISYNNFCDVDKINSKYSKLIFKNDNEIDVYVSYFILANQVIRCKKLEFELNKRKKAV